MRDVVPRLSALAAGLVLLAGCGRGNKVEDFTPRADNARKAVDTALQRWQSGQPPGTVPGTPTVEVIDSKWKAGQQLKSYEILGEDTQGSDGPRYFKVKLTPAKGPPQEVRYMVVGIDPVWVYREEDYKKQSGAGM